MKISEIPKQPFASLMAVSSVIVALLYVFGYSFRWSYYYNFGVQHIVYKLGYQSFLITALELLRVPRHLLLVFEYGIIACVIYATFAYLIRTGVKICRKRYPDRPITFAVDHLMARSSLISDAVVVVIMIYIAYAISQRIGYEAFLQDCRDKDNTLPKVTIALTDEKVAGKFPYVSGSVSESNVMVMGDAKLLQLFKNYNLAINAQNSTWRLLFRDDGYTYIFRAQSEAIGRPYVVVLPNSSNLTLIVE
jgi:hypothetical protein